ncbi:hypothetical protein [Streptomyces microflavus]|uniref:hypothetical protein n=1 Tax=Streptomyces microflavus TaxID=1919 RepID=UPI0036C1E8C8
MSNWLVHAEGVGEHIEAARKKQVCQPRRETQSGLSSSTASLRTDLELPKQQVAALPGERDKLKTALQRQLGQQLDQVGGGRVTRQYEVLTTERDTLRREKAGLEERLGRERGVPDSGPLQPLADDPG